MRPFLAALLLAALASHGRASGTGQNAAASPSAGNDEVPTPTRDGGKAGTLAAIVVGASKSSSDDGSPLGTQTQENAASPPISPKARQNLENGGKAAEGVAAGLTEPRSEAALQVGGNDFLPAGDPSQAERDGKNPQNEAAQTGHALALAQEGRMEEARQEAAKILAQYPKNPVASLIAGHADAGRQSRLIGKLSALAARLWKSPASGARPPSSWAAQAGAPAPPQPAQPAIYRMPPLIGAAFAHYQNAYGKLELRDMTGALLEATAAINDAPNSPAPWVLRSYIDNRLEPVPNSAGAQSDAGHALAIEPQNAAALRERALAEIHTGQLPQALADLAAALRLEPRNGTGYLYRAMAEEKLGRAQDAVADYQKAASLDPSLEPFATQALARLAPPAPSGFSPLAKKKLVRAGSIALSLILILAGLLGTATGRRLITRRAVITTKGARYEGSVPPPRVLAAGEVIGGNYRVLRELGRGGMGVVYEALDGALQRRVAVKQLQRADGADAQDLERFLQEARLVAQLRHPRLVEIYNVINEGDLYLVFEYMDGKSLDAVLRGRSKLPLPEAFQALCDVAAAVDYAHGRKVIHRDLKPANVMVERDGRCKVMDFGIAHQSKTATFLTQTAASGTPPYMAPEQALGSVSKASDLYALGVMAYEMLTGARPFAGPDFVEQKLRREFPAVAGRGLPAALDGFFQKALEPDPTKRYGSGAELVSAFRAACEPRAA